MKNENVHFTPQQFSKLLNLHIKSHECIAVKCQKERQQLLSTIEKLARNFYDVYKLLEKQKREMNRIVNLYNDFCMQFGLPGNVETPKQQEINNIDKVANMIYEHFFKMMEANNMNKMHQSFDEIKQAQTSTTTADRPCNGVKKQKKSESSSSSVVAIEQEENMSNNINENNGRCTNLFREKDNGKRSFNSVLVNNGSIPATNSSLSPPEGLMTRNNCSRIHCSLTSNTTNSHIDRIPTTGNHLNNSANNGEASLICERGLKRRISAGNEFGAPNKMQAVHTSNNLYTIELAIKHNYLGSTHSSNKDETPKFQQFSTTFNQANAIGGTVLITEGSELSIGHLSSLEKNPEKQYNTDIVIQLDDDD